MIVTATAAGGLNPKQDASWHKYMRAKHQSLCGGQAAACNICEATYQGRFAGQCQTDSTGPVGSPCRCASSTGWLKGSVVILDPELGIIDANGVLRRKK